MRRRITAVTSSRADYAHVEGLLEILSRHPAVDLQVVALGPHLSPEFGHTGKQIAKHARMTFAAVECLLSSDTDVGMAKSLGVATLGLAEVFAQNRPDIVLLVADRYEMLAPATVALTLRIPIAHIEGGEITAGAIDDAVRNAISKMSHIHFACTRKAAKRLVAMGEDRSRVHFSGSLSLDELRRGNLLAKTRLERKLGIFLDRTTVVAVHHPVTLLKNTTEETEEVFAALEQLEHQILITYPNADSGSRRVIQMSKRFVQKHSNSKLFVNLEHTTYLSLLQNVDLLVGNSSSGVIESTSLDLPTVNIGIRQQGREHAANVIDVPATREQILCAIEKALSPRFRRSAEGLTNPYGDGHASERIAKVLTEVPLGPALLLKTAHLR